MIKPQKTLELFFMKYDIWFIIKCAKINIFCVFLSMMTVVNGNKYLEQIKCAHCILSYQLA